MLSSNRALDLIKEYESCVLTAYPDPASDLGKACVKLGLPLSGYAAVPRWQLLKAAPVTIGWGHTGLVSLGDKIDQAMADTLLRLDVKVAEYRLMGLEGLNQNQFDALTSLAYNCPSALAQGTHLRLYLESKEWDRAADEILKWHYANKEPLPGLMRRRAAERALFLMPTTLPAPSPAA